MTAINGDVYIRIFSSKKIVNIEEKFMYKILVINDKNVHMGAVKVIDKLPDEFKVIRIYLDGNEIQGNIKEGIDIGELGPKERKEIDIEVVVKGLLKTDNIFYNKVKAEFEIIPNGCFPNNIETKEAVDRMGVRVVNPKILIEKRASGSIVTIGDVITYKIIVKNTGNMYIEDIILSDMLSPELEFIEGSISINGYREETENILSGVLLGDLHVNEVITITMKAKVIKSSSIKINSYAIASYRYKIYNDYPYFGEINYSNEVSIEIKEVGLSVSKEVEDKFLMIGDRINNKIILYNYGEVEILTAMVVDEIPAFLKLIEGTFRIDKKVVNGIELSRGIRLGEIGIGHTVTIEYQCEVVGGSGYRVRENKVKVDYIYALDSQKVGMNSTVEVINSKKLNVAMSTFKSIGLEKIKDLNKGALDINEINDIYVDVDIKKYYRVKGNEMQSNEGQTVTNNKLIVVGIVKGIIQYISNRRQDNIYTAAFTEPFSAFIMLPEEYKEEDLLQVEASVERVDYRIISTRQYGVNIDILLNVKISPY